MVKAASTGSESTNSTPLAMTTRTTQSSRGRLVERTRRASLSRAREVSVIDWENHCHASSPVSRYRK